MAEQLHERLTSPSVMPSVGWSGVKPGTHQANADELVARRAEACVATKGHINVYVFRMFNGQGSQYFVYIVYVCNH